MSMIRQFWLLLLVTIVAALLGSVAVSVDAARGYLETQLRLKNSDNAQALALSLSQLGGGVTQAEIAIAAQFNTGFYQRIRLLGPDGSVLVEQAAESQPADAPGWFVRAVPLESVPGFAELMDGWRPMGRIEVVSASSFAHDDLWRGTVRTAGWLALVGLLTATAGALVIRRLRAPLQDTVAQARALLERRFVRMPEPSVPELRELSRAMNNVVQRLQSMLGEQSAQIEALRQQTQSDELTGLANRSHFLRQLLSLAEREDAPAAAALALVRVSHLAEINRELGRAETDALLRAVATALGGAGSGQCIAGRLNGSDFALLAMEGDASAAARKLQAALRVALARWQQVGVAIGAVAWRPEEAPNVLMQRADEALARAEARAAARGDFAVDASSELPGGEQPAPVGESQWRQLLASALEQGAATVGAYSVVARSGALIHLEAPLRLRLREQGPFEPAARWLPWALRVGLAPEADLLAVRLALRQIEADGLSRGVNVAAASLLDSSFVVRLRACLLTRPEAARLLCVEVSEQVAVTQLTVLGELSRQLRPLGVKVGIEHAGWGMSKIEGLYEAGLDYVKLDASLSLGLTSDRARADFLRGLVAMLHGIGWAVYAEGLRSASDAEAVWACGVDGITGPWVGAHAAAAAAQPGRR
ncbi:EAL domain-containing protein [Caldimonas tepidiphila]|uniref:EAL domain-containing protein n=1 Tax=Caldimonas tepidiphila TaxID=2315841 RepID=UPI000E5AE055|nr:EAL domain-containing protein [Caldimonas tepidiphila]